MTKSSAIEIPGFKINDIHEDKDSYIVDVEPEYTNNQVRCPQCDSTNIVNYGKRKYAVLDIPYSGKPVKVDISRNRYRCNDCQYIFSQYLSNIDANHKMTSRAVEYIKENWLYQTTSHLADYFQVSTKTIKNILKDVLVETDGNSDFITPINLGIYDINMYNSFRRVLLNIDTATIIDILPNRDEIFIDYVTALKNKDRVHTCVVVTFQEVTPIIRTELPDVNTINLTAILQLEYNALRQAFYSIVKKILTEEEHPEKAVELLLILKGDPDKLHSGKVIADFLIPAYGTKYPSVIELYNNHNLFLEIWDFGGQPNPAGMLESYKEWLVDTYKLSSDLMNPEYTELIELLSSLEKSNGFSLLYSLLRQFDRLEQGLTILKQSEFLDRLWVILTDDNIKEDTHPNLFIEYLLKIKKVYNYYFEKNNLKNLRAGINIEALVYGIELVSKSRPSQI